MISPIVNFALLPYLGAHAHAHARETQIHLIPNLRGAVTSDAQLADGCGLQGLWESAEDICKLISVDGGETQGDCGTSHGFNLTADPSDGTLQGTAFWNHDGSDEAVDVIGFFHNDCRLEFVSTTTSMTYAGKVSGGMMEIEATRPGKPKAVVYAGKFQQSSKLASASQLGDFAIGDSNCDELEGEWRAAAYMYCSVSVDGGVATIDRVKSNRFVISMDPANTTKTFEGTSYWTGEDGNDYNADMIGFYKEDCSFKFVSTADPLTRTGKIKGDGLMEIEATLPAMQGTYAFTMTGMFKHESNDEVSDSDASGDSSESDSCNLEGAWDSTEPICKLVSSPPGATPLKVCNTSHSLELVADPGDSRGTLEGTMIFEFPNRTISSHGLIGFYKDDCTLKLVSTNTGHTLSGKVDDNGVLVIDATFPGGGEAAVTWTNIFEQS